MRRTSAVVLLLPLLAACSGGGGGGGDDGAVPNDLADSFASALADTAASLADDDPDEAAAGSGLADLTFVDAQGADVAADFVDAVDGMDGIEPTVTVADTSATAITVDWSWPLVEGHDPWTYQTTVATQETGGDWSLVWARTAVEPSLRAKEVLDATTLPAPRGDVTGAHGQVLVTDRPVVELGIDKTKVKPAEAPASARALAQLVGVDVGSYVAAVKAAGPEAFVQAIVYRRGEVPPAVRAASIPGLLTVADKLALAPTREFAAPILGRVGPVTAEMVKDDPDTYHVGDVAGVSGLEARYDDQLRGRPGRSVVATDPDSTRRDRPLTRIEPVAGKKLALTLDERLETTAENLLAGVGPASALVAIRPSDGAILAAANGPGTGGQNYATYGQFAPGSTFKIVSTLALLRSGLTPSSTVPCTPSVTVDGKRFENYDDYPPSAIGDIPLRTAIANSCNTAVISQRGRLGKDDLVDAAASLGLGVDHDLGFPAYFGSVEPPASETEGAADMIGQGTVLASPMSMATVIASVQAGKIVVPRLVEQVDVAAPKNVDEPSNGEVAALRDILRAVVTSGSGAGLADVPGPPVIAKTGTAEFDGPHGRQTHAWMVAAQGDLAVAVFVDVGSSGSGTAGPILESFLRAAG
ncbi:penicillin-binding transpeptidase domain-containing protein [Nocardioides panacisoli]|uniref:penicillin-binding transpeptidase domain-containing protein n=1 Tax=Nocardioides panacisoli TaxID=627624 RepID=UPI0031D9909C